MNTNGLIYKLKIGSNIFDKNRILYIAFDDEKKCIISHDNISFEGKIDINETIGNIIYTVNSSYKNTKIICTGFLMYYIAYKNHNNFPLNQIANEYYKKRFDKYSNNKIDINKAKAEYPTIHLSQEKAFFEYAQKNFFPLLPECDVDDLTIIYNEYVQFINSLKNEYNTKNVQNDSQLLEKYNAFATSIQSYFETRIDGTLIQHIIENKELPIGTTLLKFNEKDKFINIWYFINIFQIPIKNMKNITKEDLKHNQKSSKSYNDFANICIDFKKSID